jgi:hypothetical protein
MSFVAYILRWQPEAFTGQLDSIARASVYLMRACPGESVSVRKVPRWFVRLRRGSFARTGPADRHPARVECGGNAGGLFDLH